MRAALLALALTSTALLAVAASAPEAEANPIPYLGPIYCTWPLPYGDRTFYLVCAELGAAITAYNALAAYGNCYLNTAPTSWLVTCT